MKRVVIFAILLFCPQRGWTKSVPLIDINPQTDVSDYPLGPGQYWGFVEPANNKTWGYLFQVLEPVELTHLGWNDTDKDGLSHPHPVGLWQSQYDLLGSDGDLIVQTVIPSGTSAELSGSWRRMPVEPVILQPGWYSIGGQNHEDSTDDMVYLSGSNDLDGNGLLGPIVDPRIYLGQFFYNVNGPDGFYELKLIDAYLADGAELGPMPFFTAIPEPTTFALFVCSLFGLVCLRYHH